MQFSLHINQVRALEWGMNAQQALLFAFLYELPAWADCIDVDGKFWYRITWSKVITELPLLTDKVDTVYRLICQLRDYGLIEIGRANGSPVVHITKKGTVWNRTETASRVDNSVDNLFIAGSNSEKNPTQLGKKSGIRSEKNPTYQYTNNQYTKSPNAQECDGDRQNVDNFSPTTDEPTGSAELFSIFWDAYPKRDDQERAWTAFKRIKPDLNLFSLMMAALQTFKRSDQWQKNQGQWIPLAANWLNGHRWQDQSAQGVDKGNGQQLSQPPPGRIPRQLASDKNPSQSSHLVDFPQINAKRG